MSSIDLIRMGFMNLFRRKVRTFLTVLGVIIGTASIVVMVSLGYGMNESFKADISSMGSLNIINVSPAYGMGPNGSGGGKSTPLDDKAIIKISKIDCVEVVSPLMNVSAKMVCGKYAADIQLTGIIPEAMEALEYKVKEGRLLQKGDGLNIVFGSQLASTFYNMKSSNRYSYGNNTKPKVDVIKDKIQLTLDTSYGTSNNNGPQPEDKKKSKPAKLYKIIGVGVLEEGKPEWDYNVFISIDELKKLVKEKPKENSLRGSDNPFGQTQQGYQSAMVKVKNIDDVEMVQKKIKEMGFEAYSLTDYLKQMQKSARTIQLVLGGIGAISLLVAALGITNTMVMSIYERTREIGIMKVIGASLGDIKRLFLFEAGTIGFMGGLLGLGFSELTSLALNSFAGKFMTDMIAVSGNSRISIIPIWLAIFVLLFSTFVGLISGFYPARRAMKLSPIEAIKTE